MSTDCRVLEAWPAAECVKSVQTEVWGHDDGVQKDEGTEKNVTRLESDLPGAT
jgi:hypothetical protein